ncbi:MAG: cytochrome c, partial [Planctomycetales bacterium]|nr:cytochrome c [Planctomycetales bacterium]
ARNLFARAGRNCKVATAASYNEAKLRKQDLSDMVQGSALQSGDGDAGPTDWSLTCERSELMKRIETSNKRLRELAASPATFGGGVDEARHEGELLAAMCEAMLQSGMPDADDGDYAGMVNILKKSALDIVDASKLKNVDAASKALGEASRSCDSCHETYRG